MVTAGREHLTGGVPIRALEHWERSSFPSWAWCLPIPGDKLSGRDQLTPHITTISLTNVEAEGGHYLAYLYKSVFTSWEIRTKCGRNTQSYRVTRDTALPISQWYFWPPLPCQGYDSQRNFLPVLFLLESNGRRDPCEEWGPCKRVCCLGFLLNANSIVTLFQTWSNKITYYNNITSQDGRPCQYWYHLGLRDGCNCPICHGKIPYKRFSDIFLVLFSATIEIVWAYGQWNTPTDWRVAISIWGAASTWLISLIWCVYIQLIISIKTI